jgi:hypothetical protein
MGLKLWVVEDAENGYEWDTKLLRKISRKTEDWSRAEIV